MCHWWPTAKTDSLPSMQLLLLLLLLEHATAATRPCSCMTSRRQDSSTTMLLSDTKTACVLGLALTDMLLLSPFLSLSLSIFPPSLLGSNWPTLSFLSLSLPLPPSLTPWCLLACATPYPSYFPLSLAPWCYPLLLLRPSVCLCSYLVSLPSFSLPAVPHCQDSQTPRLLLDAQRLEGHSQTPRRLDVSVLIQHSQAA